MCANVGPLHHKLRLTTSAGIPPALRRELEDEELLRAEGDGVYRQHPQRHCHEALHALLVGKNAADVVRGTVGIPARRVRHADLVEIVQTQRGEDD